MPSGFPANVTAARGFSLTVSASVAGGKPRHVERPADIMAATVTVTMAAEVATEDGLRDITRICPRARAYSKGVAKGVRHLPRNSRTPKRDTKPDLRFPGYYGDKAKMSECGDVG